MDAIRSVRALALVTLLALAGAFSAPVSAQSFTHYAQNKLIDQLFRGQPYTFPSTLYVGLDTGACTVAGGGTEVTGGSYARVAVPATLTNWAGTQGPGTTTVSSGTTGKTSNNVAITFPAPTANWTSIVSFRIWDAATAGNALICQTLALPKTVNAGDAPPAFNVGGLTMTIQ